MGEGSPFYPVFNDFGRFICSEAEVLQYVRSAEEANKLSHVPACMQVRERLLHDGDSDIRDLVSETVETVSSCAREQDIKKWAGPEVLAVWNKQRTQFAGNRVRVSDDFFWARDATGKISEPPEAVLAISGLEMEISRDRRKAH